MVAASDQRVSVLRPAVILEHRIQSNDMILSDARIRKGENPIFTIRLPVSRSGLTMARETGILFRRRVQSTNAQEHICASTVATAAPATPISKRKINTGSSTILTTAPDQGCRHSQKRKALGCNKIVHPRAQKRKKCAAV